MGTAREQVRLACVQLQASLPSMPCCQPQLLPLCFSAAFPASRELFLPDRQPPASRRESPGGAGNLCASFLGLAFFLVSMG